MISIFFSSLLIFILGKDLVFFSSLFFFEKNIFCLILIFPLVFLSIKNCEFVKIGSSTSLIYFYIFFFLISLLMLCFCSLFSLLFLFLLECCVFLMIVLLFNFSKDIDKFSSTSFMVFMNMLGSVPFFYFCGEDFGLLTGGSSLDFTLSSPWIFFFCFLILVSKVPIFFFHFWLTKAHVSASGAGSMILASLMLKIGTLGIYKFCFFFISQSSKILFSFFCAISCFGCVLLSLVMLRFFDVKYLVACSSVVHMSLIFPSFLLPYSMGILGSLLMMVGHGLISCLIFYWVSVIYELGINRSSDSGKSMESASTLLMVFLFFFFLMNLGFPPFVGFVSEFFLICLFLKYSLFFVILFCFSLVLFGLVFIFLSMNFLFGKSLKNWYGSLDSLLSVMFSYFTFFIILVPFVFS